MYYLCCRNIVADHLTAQLLRSCSELFLHMQSRFPHDVAQMHHEQIRDLRVPHSSPLCFLAHLSRRLIGELIVYEGIRRPSVRPSVNIFKRHLL